MDGVLPGHLDGVLSAGAQAIQNPIQIPSRCPGKTLLYKSLGKTTFKKPLQVPGIQNPIQVPRQNIHPGAQATPHQGWLSQCDIGWAMLARIFLLSHAHFYDHTHLINPSLQQLTVTN